jgi:hypothetical protein
VLTAERLRSLLRYSKRTGLFHWRVDRGHNRCKGKVAGRSSESRRNTIRIDGRDYAGSRLAVLYTDGIWPALMVDHRDGSIRNDRRHNLRLATNTQNQQNQRRAHVDSAHGLLGATFNRQKKLWASRIAVGGRRVFLGYFDDAELAHLVYLSAKETMHPFQEIVK